MSDLVRVRVDDAEFNVGRAYATAHDLDVLEESAYDRTGTPRPVTRANGRTRKTKTSVAELAAEKKAAQESADTIPPSDKEN